jgi:hypothetical protein
LGVNLDLHSLWPGHEIIHLRGAMVMLTCLFFGVKLSIRRIRACVPYWELPLTEPVHIAPEPPGAGRQPEKAVTRIYTELPQARPLSGKARAAR